MQFVPNEILCEQISYITDVNDIIQLRQTDSTFRELSTYCIRVVSGDLIPLQLVLALQNVVEVNGIVNVNTIESLQRLSLHPTLKRIRVRYTDGSPFKITDNIYTLQCQMLRTLIGSKNTDGLDMSIIFPDVSQSDEYGISMQTIGTMGISGNVLYIQVQENGTEKDSRYFGDVNKSLNVFNGLNIDTFISDISLGGGGYTQNDFMLHIHDLNICIEPRPYDDEFFGDMLTIAYMGNLQNIKLCIPSEDLDYVNQYKDWIIECLYIAVNAFGHGLNPTNKRVNLDIPFYDYENTIDMIQSMFTNIGLIGIAYENDEKLLLTLNKLLPRKDIQTIIVYSNQPITIPIMDSRIVKQPYSECLLYNYLE